MKKLHFLLALTLSLVFIFFTGVLTVSASPAPSSEEAQPPQVIDFTPDIPFEEQAGTDAAPGMIAPTEDGNTVTANESQEETQQPARYESNNTPYFIGAVIAVVVFIGVALYCKFNGGGAIR